MSAWCALGAAEPAPGGTTGGRTGLLATAAVAVCLLARKPLAVNMPLPPLRGAGGGDGSLNSAPSGGRIAGATTLGGGGMTKTSAEENPGAAFAELVGMTVGMSGMRCRTSPKGARAGGAGPAAAAAGCTAGGAAERQNRSLATSRRGSLSTPTLRDTDMSRDETRSAFQAPTRGCVTWQKAPDQSSALHDGLAHEEFAA